VSICIALTVVLIRILNPTGKSDRSVFIATVFYSEQAPPQTRVLVVPRCCLVVCKLIVVVTAQQYLSVWTVQPADSAGQKSAGALANAAVFVVVVTAMTFLLVWLFKKCARQSLHYPNERLQSVVDRSTLRHTHT